MIIIYSSPTCQPCAATKRMFAKAGIEFEERDAIAHAEYLREQGYKTLPVVVTPENTWEGFRPDLIKEVAV